MATRPAVDALLEQWHADHDQLDVIRHEAALFLTADPGDRFAQWVDAWLSVPAQRAP